MDDLNVVKMHHILSIRYDCLSSMFVLQVIISTSVMPI